MNPLRLAGRFDHFPCLLRKRFAKRACGGRFKQRIVRNLIRRAACLGDEFDKDGKLIKEGMGDLQAILAIIERLEGKPKQQITGLDNGPVQVQYRTVEEVHMYLLGRGMDSLRVPPPPLKLVSKE